MEVPKDKFILDACCGGRQFWFDKNQKNAIFMDIREEKAGCIKLQPNFSVSPDIIGDYTDMVFPEGVFKLVVWDVPHKIKRDKGIITKKYGYLGEDWQVNLAKGFAEIMRVLDDYGVLEFKFADFDIPIKEVLRCFPIKPLFGTITKKGVNNTYWFCFMKIPRAVERLGISDFENVVISIANSSVISTQPDKASHNKDYTKENRGEKSER